MSDISASKIQNWLAEKRKPIKSKDDKIREGASIRTSNFYLQAFKQFCRWLVADNRMPENPIAYLQGQNPNSDIRHQRRALNFEEIQKLLCETKTASVFQSMNGFERYMLYALALATGFRAAELASLLWQGLELDSDSPTITISAGYTKNRKEATLPLRNDIAELFRKWQTEKNFNSKNKVFNNFNKNKAAKMLRYDLDRAGIEYQDQTGRFADFHSLRHSFITNIGKTGASIKEHQSLARHSKADLTLGVYTHLSISDERRAIEKMPSFIEPQIQHNQAKSAKTGTDNLPLNTLNHVSKESIPELTPDLTPSAYFDNNRPTMKETDWQTDGAISKSLNSEELGTEKTHLATGGNNRRRWDSNPRITVLQTVALGRLATPPDGI